MTLEELYADQLAAERYMQNQKKPPVSLERQALIEAHKALTHAQRLIDRALGRGK